jgi:hypothetical protein
MPPFKQKNAFGTFLLLVSFCVARMAAAQVPPTQTEVLIIGTKHNGNAQFNEHTLLDTLKSYLPQLILWEHSAPFKRMFGLLTARWLRVASPPIEQLALQLYSRFDPSVPILPFDTTIASRRVYIREMVGIRQAFFDSLSKAAKSPEDSILYMAFLQKNNDYYSSLSRSSLARINQPDVFLIAGELHNIEREKLIALGRRYIADTAVCARFEADARFWVARNDFMVAQIRKHIAKNRGKRILILTGLNHKYYLSEKLAREEGSAIRLINLGPDKAAGSPAATESILNN